MKSAHEHTFRLPPPNGPFAVATCACGATTIRRNAWEGDYSPEEWATHIKRGHEKSIASAKAKHTMPKMVFGKTEKGVA